MELFLGVVKTILILTGAVAWLLGLFLVVFFWLCQQPPKD
jgi:hypothetical protein